MSCQYCAAAKADVNRFKKKAAAANKRIETLERELRTLLLTVQHVAHNAAMAEALAKQMQKLL